MAEVAIFELIRDAEGMDSYVCLHSVGIARHQRKEYAEADFILIGPAGIFCLEVKGGHVERRDGVWTIGWPNGLTYQSKEGPFMQAQGVRWALLGFLKSRLQSNGFRHLRVGWGVAFPDIVFDRVDPEWDKAVVYDQRDKPFSFLRYVLRLQQYFEGRAAELGKQGSQELSASQVNQVVDVIRGDFDVVPTIKGLVLESKRELVRLSSAQFSVLNFALNEDNPRILCQGAAGTGKTLIAIEAARRLSARGLKVLLLCFNENLNRFLSADVGPNGILEVSTLHSFLGRIIKKGGFGSQLASARTQRSDASLFEETYPALFESAALALIEEGGLALFDAIIIDEAQDVLTPGYMNCLDMVLEGGIKRGRWMIFFDPDVQSHVYGRLDGKTLDGLKQCAPASFALYENFRNPRAIISEMCTVIGLSEPECRRELNSKVDYISFSDERSQGKKLRALLVELMRDGASPSDITVLSASKKADACIMRYPPAIGQEVVYLDGNESNHARSSLTAASISAFKGLENEIIILTDLPRRSRDDAWTRSMFYVGMTRARSKLFALVSEGFIDDRFSH